MSANSQFSNLLLIALQLYLWVVVLRAILQYFQADFHNPFSLFIDRLTKPFILALRQFLPRIGGADILSPIVLVGIVATAERVLAIFQEELNFSLLGLVFIVIARVLRIVTYVFIAAVLARVIISWVAPRKLSITRLIVTVSEPLMSPVRKILPTFGGLDFSPIIVFLALELFNGLVVLNIETWGYSLLA